MLDRLEFLLSEAIVSLQRNRWMTFAAVTTSAMALFIIGGLGYAYLALANTAAAQESRFEINVFVRDDASPDQAKALGDRIRALEGVKTLDFKSRNEVWNEFRKENPEITAGLDIENPMPDQYTLTFERLDQAAGIADAIKKMPEVDPRDGVQYMGEVQQFLEQSLAAIRLLGIVLGGLMLLTGGILIYNTIRLTMVARNKEIRIMQLVGATKQTVWTPLLVEGVVQGVLGATLATLTLWAAHEVVVRLIQINIPTFVPGPFPVLTALLVITVAGALYGLVCSFLAIRERKPAELPR